MHTRNTPTSQPIDTENPCTNDVGLQVPESKDRPAEGNYKKLYTGLHYNISPTIQDNRNLLLLADD